jgi:aspartyl-tRNA(Asn)/glutamyl-tRNA(Gln) amidotransferase subunit A
MALGPDVLGLTVAELGPRIRARQVSPVELTEAYLARIAALDPKLHAFATPTPEVARAQAREAESQIAAGHYRGPLHGIPYGAKDLLSTKGIRTTWGAKPFEDRVLDTDATVIRRLREAGAVLVGKLAMIELAGGLGYTIPGASLTGPALNPWNLDRWTCGSSSGSGAAVSASLVSFAIGSETWGSIVCPSSFCGISGMRPTFGRVSRHGAMALSWTLDKLGPMARSAEDCEILLGILSGQDPEDDWSLPEPPPVPFPAERARSLKVAWIPFDFAKAGEPEVKATLERALADLRRAGITIAETELPDLPYEDVAGVILAAEAASAFESLFRDGQVRQLADRGAPLAAATARVITGADYVKALRIRTLCQRAMADFFSKWDLLLSPGEPVTAYGAHLSYEEAEKEQWPDPVGGMGNLCGLPCASVPCGFGKDGLPVGLSIVGGAFEDAKVLGLAKFYQTVTDWHRKHPPIS